MSLQDPTGIEALVAVGAGAAGATVAQSMQPIPTIASQGAGLTLGEAALAYGALSLLFPALPGGRVVGAMGAGALLATAAGWQIPNADLPAALGGTLGTTSALPPTPAGGTTPAPTTPAATQPTGQ